MLVQQLKSQNDIEVVLFSSYRRTHGTDKNKNDPANAERTLKAKQQFGGKAVGLVNLRNVLSRSIVPEFYVIPTDVCKTRPVIDLSAVNRMKKYAVRSGAPQSMPGTMATVLGVERSKLHDAINAVWDSYHSPSCVAYREALNVPDTGTAVIIQELIETPKYSGVMFTHEPSTLSKWSLCEPVIQYVEGYGDKLVSGEVNALTMGPDMPDGLHNSLSNYAKRIFESLGHSDIEWCYTEGGDLKFLQHRAMVLPKPVFVKPPEQVGELLVYGKPIGAPGSAVGVVSDAAEFVEGNVLYVPMFTPEIYGLMLKASAVICATGDKLCHAAIVAMSTGIPVISGVPVEEFALHSMQGLNVYIDGVAGSIFRAVEGVEYKTVVEKQAITPAAEKYRLPSIIYSRLGEARGERLNISTILLRFYWMVANGGRQQPEFELAVSELAHIVVSYMYIAAMGEARYAVTYSVPDYVKEMRLLGFPMAHPKLPRGEYQKYVPEPESLETVAKALRATQHIHNTISTGGISGPKWGRIAEVAADYIEGLTSPELFLDVAFNLQHNNGTLFSKCPWLLYNSHTLEAQLNARLSGGILELKASTAGSWWVDMAMSWDTMLKPEELAVIDGKKKVLTKYHSTYYEAIALEKLTHHNYNDATGTYDETAEEPAVVPDDLKPDPIVEAVLKGDSFVGEPGYVLGVAEENAQCAVEELKPLLVLESEPDDDYDDSEDDEEDDDFENED
jgi:phosphohistidine swiveling domain-containing protein